jgi:hypothetical protein
MRDVPEEQKPWCVFVAGSRDLSYTHIAQIARYVERFSAVRYSIMIHGAGPAGSRPGAVGCDRLVDMVSRALKLRVFAALPLWEIHGKPGGPIRNDLMVNVLTSHYQAGYRLAAGFFPTGGPGTADAIKKTRAITTVPIQIDEFPIELE